MRWRPYTGSRTDYALPDIVYQLPDKIATKLQLLTSDPRYSPFLNTGNRQDVPHFNTVRCTENQGMEWNGMDVGHVPGGGGSERALYLTLRTRWQTNCYGYTHVVSVQKHDHTLYDISGDRKHRLRP